MAYDVDFWYISQDACQITTDFTPFSEHEEESIYMKTSDFSEMIERFTDPDLERKAKALDEVTKFITERLNEEKTTDEYDYGERFMCEEIKRLLEDEVDED